MKFPYNKCFVTVLSNPGNYAGLKAESCNVQVKGQSPLWGYTFYQGTDKGKLLMIFSANI